MNDYKFEDIVVGKTESFTVPVTEERMAFFREITGDLNPLHNDENYERKKGYEGRVCYGLLTTSFLSTLAGMYLPGEHSLIQNVKVSFRKPVMIGDILTVTGTVTERQERFSMFQMKVEIKNQHAEKVLKGTMQIGVSE